MCVVCWVSNISGTIRLNVLGEFPDGEVTVDQPILTVHHKLGLNAVSETEGKPSQTRFERLGFNGRTSVVRCGFLLGSLHSLLMLIHRYPSHWANTPDPGSLAVAWFSHRERSIVSASRAVAPQRSLPIGSGDATTCGNGHSAA